MLPHGFTKIRHYGFMPPNSRIPLQKIRELICALYEIIADLLPPAPEPRKKKPCLSRRSLGEGGDLRALRRNHRMVQIYAASHEHRISRTYAE